MGGLVNYYLQKFIGLSEIVGLLDFKIPFFDALMRSEGVWKGGW